MNPFAYSVTVIAPAAVEPVTLAEAKLHLKRDDTADDALIAQLISAARANIEHKLGRALGKQTLELVLDTWPCGSVIQVPRSPLQSVTSIKYTDSVAVETTMPVADYVVDTDSRPGRISLGTDESWPSTTLQPISGVRIRFVAGYSREFTFTADATTDLLTATAHGLVDGEDMILRSSGALPGAFVADTRYFVITSSTNTFQLSATKGGAAVNITSQGTGTHTAARGIPLNLRQAMLLLVGNFYMNRESVLVGGFGLVAAEMPQSVTWLIGEDRARAF